VQPRQHCCAQASTGHSCMHVQQLQQQQQQVLQWPRLLTAQAARQRSAGVAGDRCPPHPPCRISTPMCCVDTQGKGKAQGVKYVPTAAAAAAVLSVAVVLQFKVPAQTSAIITNGALGDETNRHLGAACCCCVPVRLLMGSFCALFLGTAGCSSAAQHSSCWQLHRTAGGESGSQ
jgi:hypothetical protein